MRACLWPRKSLSFVEDLRTLGVWPFSLVLPLLGKVFFIIFNPHPGMFLDIRERGRGERDEHLSPVAPSTHPTGDVPRPGMEPATLWCTGRRANHLRHPARVQVGLAHEPHQDAGAKVDIAVSGAAACGERRPQPRCFPFRLTSPELWTD